MPTPQPKDSDATPDPARLKRLPFLIDPLGQAVIKRAVQLRLATMGEVASDDPELHGAILVSIASAWMQTEAERLRAVRA